MSYPASTVAAMEAGSLRNNFFGERSPYLGHPLLDDERTRAEVDEMAARLADHAGTLVRVLDMGCGFGRHAVEFARRGAEVTAVDPSAAMLDAAQINAANAGLDGMVDFRLGPGQLFVADEPYDLALALFTTLGQMTAIDDDDIVHDALLAAMFNALRPGGHAVIEVPDRELVAANLVTDETLGSTHVVRAFDEATSVVTERFVLDDGTTFDLLYRVFARDELRALLHDAGFVVADVIEQALVPPPPSFMTFYARRPG